VSDIDIVWSIFLAGTLLCEIVALLLLWRLVRVLSGLTRVLDNVWSGQRLAPVDSKSAGHQQSKKQEQVGELPPEIIAPSLKKPPRPEGGFGSRVGKGDGNPQLHKRDQSQNTGNES
jgi:hypothetical protein